MVVETEPYGITKTAGVLNFLKGHGASTRDKLIDAFDALQADPFPPKSETNQYGPSVVTTWMVATIPWTQVEYIVDETKRKVYVTSVMEMRFYKPED